MRLGVRLARLPREVLDLLSERNFDLHQLVVKFNEIVVLLPIKILRYCRRPLSPDLG